MSTPKRPTVRDRRAIAQDIYGRRKPETIAQFFDFETVPERAGYKVTRAELAGILAWHFRAQRQNRWHSRLWRWLKARVGSGGVHAVEPPTGEPPKAEPPEPSKEAS